MYEDLLERLNDLIFDLRDSGDPLKSDFADRLQALMDAHKMSVVENLFH